MDNLEKILFIDITCHHFGKPNTNHPNYIETWQRLSENEKATYTKLTNEIHEVWSYVNMPKIIPVKQRVNSVFEYHELIQPVDERILKVCNDFEISLKEELTEEFKATAKKIFGDDYFTWFDS